MYKRLNDRQAAIERFGRDANEQEFAICRFLIGWSVAGIAGIAGHFLLVIGAGRSTWGLPYAKGFMMALASLGLSLVFGLWHHFHFVRMLEADAKELDAGNRRFLSMLHEKGKAAIPTIALQLREEYSKEPSIKTVGRIRLYVQAVLFLAGSTAAVISLFIK